MYFNYFPPQHPPFIHQIACSHERIEATSISISLSSIKLASSMHTDMVDSILKVYDAQNIILTVEDQYYQKPTDPGLPFATDRCGINIHFMSYQITHPKDKNQTYMITLGKNPKNPDGTILFIFNHIYDGIAPKVSFRANILNPVFQVNLPSDKAQLRLIELAQSLQKKGYLVREAPYGVNEYEHPIRIR